MKKSFVIFICISLSLAIMAGCGKSEQEEASLFAIDPLSMDSTPTPQPANSAEVQGLEVVSENLPTASADPAALRAARAAVQCCCAAVCGGGDCVHCSRDGSS